MPNKAYNDFDIYSFYFLTKGKIKKCGCFHFSSYIRLWCFYFFVWCFCGHDFLALWQKNIYLSGVIMAREKSYSEQLTEEFEQDWFDELSRKFSAMILMKA